MTYSLLPLARGAGRPWEPLLGFAASAVPCRPLFRFRWYHPRVGEQPGTRRVESEAVTV